MIAELRKQLNIIKEYMAFEERHGGIGSTGE